MDTTEHIPVPVLELARMVARMGDADIYVKDHDISVTIEGGQVTFTRTMEWNTTITVDKLLEKKP